MSARALPSKLPPHPELERHLSAFCRQAVDVLERRELESRLNQALHAGNRLRVKFGMDPSSPDLHVGHAIPLRKLRELQDLGHTAVLIVGDSTAMVGDPSGRNKLRPQLTRASVEANLLTYTQQAGLVLDMPRAEVRRNSEWFDRMGFEDVLRLAARRTVAQMIERDTFAKRLAAGEPVGIHEFLYPLMQGWDSVMVHCDVELGGTDQLFNLLVGRELQAQEAQAGQVCITTPLIDGLDGRKMSKSYANTIALTDPANEIFGKVMSLSDAVMPTWMRTLTNWDEARIQALLAGHPREAKAALGEELAAAFCGPESAGQARSAFDRQFQQGALPEQIPEIELAQWPAEGYPLMVLLRELKLAASSSDARRVIVEGGVKLDGELHKDPNERILRGSAPLLVQVGKRRFARAR